MQNCKTCIIRSKAVNTLNPKELRILMESCAETTYNPRESIIKEGMLSSHIAYLKSGLAMVSKKGVKGVDQILKIVQPGNYIGLQTILFEKINQFSVTALEKCVVCFIDNLSFSIKSGEMVAIVGPSGAGKTTLVNLIPRFYEVTGGEITIDNEDIRDMTFESLRKQIGIVTQETFLFNDSVKNNIAYGRSDIPMEQITEAAKAANAHEFINDMPEGYDTIIGERGVRLSGGQRQRLAIARAILKNPNILIFDEATSALDTESEKLVQEAIDRLVENRTVFAIAHRLSTIQHADKILVLENGKLVQMGNHETLLNDESGLYRKLHDMQFSNMNNPRDVNLFNAIKNKFLKK